MNEAMVYLSAVGFALTVFPFHIYNYIYINTEKKYGGFNIGVFRLINLINLNTVEDSPGKMQVNGKNKEIDLRKIKFSAYKIFNSLCIYKIVQLCDFGLKEQKNAYIALLQSSLTTAIYKFIQINGNYTKLRNYSILNHEHGFIRYYCKSVTIINSIVVGKIILILILEKINAYKTQKK